MKLFIQGKIHEGRAFAKECDRHGVFDYVYNDCEHNILQAMQDVAPDAAVVLTDGAQGMEAAMIVRRLYPTLPLIWFSDDHAFATQAYRLQASYFGGKEEWRSRLRTALSRAGLITE